MGEIIPWPLTPRLRFGVRRVDGGWRALVLLADGRQSKRFPASGLFDSAHRAFEAAKVARQKIGIPVEPLEVALRAIGPGDGGPGIAA